MAMGRPPKYKTVTELEKAIEEYFDSCDNRIMNVYVKEAGDNIPVSNPAPYTMAGLAYSLGLSRQGLMEYKGKKEFSDTIKRARARVEVDIETRLLEGKSPAGAIFNLKNNFGWKDKSEVDNNVKVVTPIMSLDDALSGNNSNKED